jgi:hypothetical protein
LPIHKLSHGTHSTSTLLSMLAIAQPITTTADAPEASNKLSSCKHRSFRPHQIPSWLRTPVRHPKHASTKTLKRLVSSVLEETDSPKLNSIMSSLEIQKLTGAPSGSTPCKTTNGFRELKWICSSILVEFLLTTGLENQFKSHTRLLICGWVTLPWKFNKLELNQQIAPPVWQPAQLVATGQPKYSPLR